MVGGSVWHTTVTLAFPNAVSAFVVGLAARAVLVPLSGSG